MKPSTLSFGEVLWDLLPDARILGGAPFNFAFRLHGLGDRTSILSRLGKDDLGAEALEWLSRAQMDLSLVQTDERKATGSVRITFDENKVADVTVAEDVAFDHIVADGDAKAAAKAANCICFGTVAQRSEDSRNALHDLLAVAADALKVFDINLRKNCYTAEVVDSSLMRSDMLKMNELEMMLLQKMFGLPSGDPISLCAAICKRWHLRSCLLTLEERGALAVSADGENIYVPGYGVPLADPLGAGDAFTAGFIHQLLRHRSSYHCLTFGNLMGAIVASQHGATAPISDDDRDHFLRSKPIRVVDQRLISLLRKEEELCHS